VDSRIAHLVSVAVIALASVACQSAAVTSFHKNHDLPPGNTAAVEPFGISGVVWTGEHGEHTPQEIQQTLHADLLKALPAVGIQVQEGAGVVIRGTIELVHAGNGFSRSFWGFGAGKSRLVCHVEMYDNAVSTTLPAYVVQVEGGTHGKGGLQAAGYPCLADAGDAAEQIARFLRDKRQER
jgi:hypothetical protein